MEYVLVNKKTVRKSKEMKTAQKLAKKYFGRVRGKAPKAKIGKIVDITDISFVDLTGSGTGEQTDASKCNVPGHIDGSADSAEMITAEDVIRICETHNLTGRSGNGYPTAAKLRAIQSQDEGHRILIVNGVECDPGLVHDAWLYRNQFDVVAQGIEILQECFPFKESFLATREPLCRENGDYGFQQVRVPNRFPCGYEKELVKFILGTELGEDEYPLDRGILVINLQTVIALAEGVYNAGKDTEKPETSVVDSVQTAENKYLTVANLFTGNAVVVHTPVGKSGEEILHTVFPQNAGLDRKLYIGGGALNCHELSKTEAVSQETNFLAVGEMPDYSAAANCKGCGGCSRNCPKGIRVRDLVREMEKGNTPKASEFGAQMCIGCGACTYMCQAGKDVRAMVAQVKNGEV